MRSAQRLAVIASLVILGASSCARANSLSALAPVSPASSWRSHEVPDSPLTVRLPKSYRKRNDFGCYNADTSHHRGDPGTRDLCISLLSTVQADGVDIEHAPASQFGGVTFPDGQCRDCTTFSDIRSDTIALGGRRAILVRAYASGGVSGKYNVPTCFVRITLRPDSVAFVEAEYGDVQDLNELLGIASTIALR